MTQPGGEHHRDDAEKQPPLHGSEDQSSWDLSTDDQSAEEESAEEHSAENPDAGSEGGADHDADSDAPLEEETELLGADSESRAEDPDASDEAAPEDSADSSEEGSSDEAASAGTAAAGVGSSDDDSDAPVEKVAAAATSRRSRREASGDVPSERLNALPFVLAAALVIVLTGGVLWWLLGREDEEPVDHTRAENPTNGIILSEAPPEEWLTGDCLRDFDPEDDLAPVTIIDCDWDYDAQLIHWEDLEGEEHSGEEQAMSVCHAAQEEVLDQEAVDEYHALEGVVAHPDESTWEDDRRVNCLLQRADGEQMNGNFVVDPEEDSSAEVGDEDVAEEGAQDDAEQQTEQGEADEDAQDEDPENGGGEAGAEEAEDTA